MKRLPHIAVLIAMFACDFNPAAEAPVNAASTLAKRYEQQKLNIHAAGHDCRILVVQANTPLDRATVESLHYRTDGIQQSAEDEKFRAVVYRDEAGGMWTYGATTLEEAKEMRLCR